MAPRWLTLLLNQREVVDRVEDDILALVAARMTGDEIAAAADRHLVDIAAQPDIAVTIGDRHGIVVLR